MAYTIISAIGECQLSDTTNYAFVNSNPCAFMTLNNIVIFCDDVEIKNYIADSTIFELPESSMFPDFDIIFPIIVTDKSVSPNQIKQSIAKAKNNGTIVLLESFTDAIVHLNGQNFHANSKYYNPTIGNIYNNGTSPLSVQ